MGLVAGEFDLMTTFPRAVLRLDQRGCSMTELQLVPNAVLEVHAHPLASY